MSGPQAQLLTARAAALAKELEFFARTRVEGFLKGQNASRLKGASLEFLHHRMYMPGDDLRTLDWRVFARTDRLVTREYEELTNLDAVLALDTSGSMGYAGAGMSKLDFARRCAAMLAYLCNSQNDRYGLALLGAQLDAWVRPGNGRRHLAELFRCLVSAEARGETDIGARAAELAARVRRRSVFLFLSDGYQDPQALTRGLGTLRLGGHDVVFFQIYDPAETDLEFAGFTQFRDLETGQVDSADPQEIRLAYREVFRMHQERLGKGTARFGVEFAPLPVRSQWDLALARLLRQRTP